MRGKSLLFPFLTLLPSILPAQEDTSGNGGFVSSFGLSASYTYTLVHTPEIDEVRGSRPIGITASYQKQFLDSIAWEHCACNPRTGLMGGWFYLDDPETLGNSAFLAGFAEPFIWTGRRIDLSLRGVFGATYQDSPYHPERNPENQAYSTKFSFFLQFGVHGHIRLDDRNSLKLSAIYDHSSNGGVAKPNKGLNHPGFSIGYERSLSPLRFPDRDPSSRTLSNEDPRLDLIVFGGGKTIGSARDKFYGFGGHQLRYAHPLSPLHGMTFGAAWLVDGALRKELRGSGRGGTDHQRGSLTLGHEFRMGRFLFTQQLGVYLYDPSGTDDPIYHRWGLSYHLTPRHFIGLNLKAHRHIADHIDLRFGISFGHEQRALRTVD